MIQTTLEFVVPIWISVPADVHRRFIEHIYTRVGMVSSVATTSEDIIAELDAQGFQYELDFTLDNVTGIE